MKKSFLLIFSFFALCGISLATISGTTNSVSYTCTNTTGPFVFTFPVYASTDLVVTETYVSTGTITPITSYTSTPVNNDYMNGGSITLSAACASGYNLTVARDTAMTQAQVFTDGMPALYSTFESALDKLTMEVQDIPAGAQGIPGPSGGNLGLTSVYTIENFTSLTTAIATIGATVSTLIVDTPQTVTTLTIPSTLNLVVTKGGIITVGTSLAINGPFNAGFYQVFSGAGTVTFGSGSVKEYIPQWWGWLPDGTDRSTAALAMINSVYASGGGAVFFPLASSFYRADSQLLIPNNGNAISPAQTNMRLYGPVSGKFFNGLTGGGYAVLDLRYHSIGGKITTLGGGTFEIDHLVFTDGYTSNTTPFVYSTQTVVLVHDNYFAGSGGAQDAFVLGGTGGSYTNMITSEFAGFGTHIHDNSFYNIGMATLNYTANSVTINDNISSGTCGQNRAMNLNGSATGYISGANIYGNLIEMNAYIYGILGNYVTESNFYANTWADSNVNVVGAYYLTNSTYNNITLTAAGGYQPVAGDTTSLTQNNFTASGAISYATLTLTGISQTSPSNLTTGRYNITNGVVTLEIDALIGTSDATTMTLTGLPAVVTPARTQYFQVYLEDNAGFSWGVVIVSGTTLTFGKAYPTAGSFTGSSSKGIPYGFTITYNLQ